MARIGRFVGLLLAGALGCMAANTETVLENFAASAERGTLAAGLISGPDGELYGTDVRAARRTREWCTGSMRAG